MVSSPAAFQARRQNNENVARTNEIAVPKRFQYGYEHGYVYFITCEADAFPVKIGFAKDPERRIAQMQVSMPYDVVKLALYPTTRLQEKKFHKQFRAHRLRGEWFARAPEILEMAAKLKAGEGPIFRAEIDPWGQQGVEFRQHMAAMRARRREMEESI
jgi:hypothetical protein